jgi:single-strand DNA-binding protein
MNRVFLTGNLCADPESRYLSDGALVVSARIGVSHGKDKESSFVSLTLWEWCAKIAAKLKKGQRVQVEGYLKEDRWEKDGQKRSQVKIVVTEIAKVEFVKIEEEDQAPPVENDGTDPIPF